MEYEKGKVIVENQYRLFGLFAECAEYHILSGRNLLSDAEILENMPQYLVIGDLSGDLT